MILNLNVQQGQRTVQNNLISSSGFLHKNKITVNEVAQSHYTVQGVQMYAPNQLKALKQKQQKLMKSDCTPIQIKTYKIDDQIDNWKQQYDDKLKEIKQKGARDRVKGKQRAKKGEGEMEIPIMQQGKQESQQNKKNLSKKQKMENNNVVLSKLQKERGKKSAIQKKLQKLSKQYKHYFRQQQKGKQDQNTKQQQQSIEDDSNRFRKQKQGVGKKNNKSKGKYKNENESGDEERRKSSLCQSLQRINKGYVNQNENEWDQQLDNQALSNCQDKTQKASTKFTKQTKKPNFKLIQQIKQPKYNNFLQKQKVSSSRQLQPSSHSFKQNQLSNCQEDNLSNNGSEFQGNSKVVINRNKSTYSQKLGSAVHMLFQ